MNFSVVRKTILVAASLVCSALVGSAGAAEVRHFKFGYDTSPTVTAYGIAADMFANKLKELSNGTMIIDQFPNAQLGTEAQTIQLVKTGDVDFCIVATANAATIVPEMGVVSLHYLFRSEAQLDKVLADPKVLQIFQQMVAAKTSDLHVVGITSLGLRSAYGRKEIRSIKDMKGLKFRVMATNVEDVMFGAYGSQTVHLPIQQVYTALQTGLIDMAENNPDNYFNIKHYEVGPILSLTEHEPAISPIFLADKTWRTLSDEQKKWIIEAGADVARTQPAQADRLAHEAVIKLEKLGVKVIAPDKKGFIDDAVPLQDKLAEKLGPNASELVKFIHANQ